MYKYNIGSRAFLPILSYSLSSFYLLGYIFFIELEKLPAWISIILIGVPFLGRMLTPFVYSKFTGIFGIEKGMINALIIMSIISLADSFLINYPFLIVTRFSLGVMFGIATSASIELASLSENRKVIGLTMGGWAIGWILSALLYLGLGTYMFLPGILSLSLLSLKTQRYHVNKLGSLSFSWKAFVIFFLGFVPAYLMQLIPSMLGSKAFVETVIGYSLSLFAYLLFPTIKRVLSGIIVINAVIILTAILGYLTLNIGFLAVFTMFGLGLNSLLPILARKVNVEPSKIGPSMNLASFGGLLFPELTSLAFNDRLMSSLILSISSILFVLLVFLMNRRVNISKKDVIVAA
ncbi:hypothetical protein [Sulfuracidifex tepidarius]|uniref:Transporter n=1 Tax=Sulfuracidifex tepidarius TaxID=1294262 RepID=A0A510DYX7_9CREN|nr:hypothetical protein [Sulfuracidifex tepidarius]BBG25453.1 hypothetical protein IC006_2789 [Sulfuracidifex tepidarius]BBG28247.1 hypothetical protein IC007_2803 [Sulfuracidifex tepidarius]